MVSLYRSKSASSSHGFGSAKLVGPIHQVMVRGLKKVDQLFVLTMATYNLIAEKVENFRLCLAPDNQLRCGNQFFHPLLLTVVAMNQTFIKRHSGKIHAQVLS